jgi:hypothetical protein
LERQLLFLKQTLNKSRPRGNGDRMSWRPDVAVAIVGAALGLGALAAVPTQIRGQGYGAIADIQSPAFFPILIALLMVAMSILLLTARRREPPNPAQAGDETGPVEAPRRLAAAALCLAAYYGALELIGMVTASVLVIGALALTLGYRRYGVLAAVAAAVPVILFLAFEKGLFVLLPEGRLF